MTCNHCGASVTSGLVLCDLCQRKLTTILEYLPVYFRNLARWQPGRAGARPVPGSRVLYEGDDTPRTGEGDRITAAVDAAFLDLTVWANVLVTSRPYLGRLLDRLTAARDAGRVDEPQAVAWLCAGFLRHLTAIATLDWAGEFIRKLDYHERRLRGLTETAVPGWYAGACRRCGSATYVVPGLTWVTCNGIVGHNPDDPTRPLRCGATTYARDHLELILDEAADWVAPPKQLAQAVVALLDTEQSVPRLHDRIRQWGSRWPDAGIEPIRAVDADGDDVGPRRYRLGDVLAQLRVAGQTPARVSNRKVTS